MCSVEQTGGTSSSSDAAFRCRTAAACTTSTYVDGSEYVETLVGQVGDAVVREVEVAQLDEQTEVERHRADPVERHVEMLRYDTTRHEMLF